MAERGGTTGVAEQGPSAALVTLIAVAVGALVANLYYAQPLIASIGPEIGVQLDLAGSIVSVTQIGYGVGLFFLVSLADLVENKTLVMVTLGLTALGLVGMALSTTALPLFVASFVIGVCSTGAQVLLPMVVQLMPIERRGRLVGNLMGGLLGGIMLARPVALFIAASFGWRAVFWASSVLMIAIGVGLYRMLPRHQPKSGMHYGQILGSMLGLAREMPAVRWRAIYQALMFMAFNMFWTTAPLMLADRFHLSQYGIGLFALAGAGGALAAPIAGRLADLGLGNVLTFGAMMTLSLCFFGTSFTFGIAGLIVLVLLTIALDAAVQVNQIVGQRIIFSVSAERRGRVNAIYMTTAFAGGAIGSIAGTLTYHSGGWTMTAVIGALVGALAFLLFMIELRTIRAVA